MTIQARNFGGPFDFIVTNSSELSSITNPLIGQTALATADGTMWYHTGSAWAAVSAGGGSGAPSDADYLVGTANGSLSAEIAVGTSPGGELGGTWASPTVDATHSGSAHLTLGSTAQAVGTSAGGSGTTASKVDHVHATGAGTPSTQAFSDSAATGSGPAAAMTDHKHAMPALGTSAAAVGTSAGGSATTPSKSDHVHATGAGTPSTQAFGDAAATGTGPAAAMTDHKHAMPAAPAIVYPGPTGALAETVPRALVASSYTMVSGTLRMAAIYLRAGMTVTSVGFVTNATALVQGATSNHLWGALFDGSLNLLAQSTDDTNPAWAIQTAKTFTLTAAQAISTSGTYYIGLLAAITGAGAVLPAVWTVGSSNGGIQAVPPILSGSSTTGLTTTAPNPAAGLSILGVLYGYVT